MWANAQRGGRPAEYIGGALCSMPPASLRFGHSSSVTGHKTSAVSRPCISQDRSMAVVKSRNNRKIASENQSKHSKRLGQC